MSSTPASRPASTALITGASTGIGRELARCFAAGGHGLVITARDQERLTTLAAELAREHRVPVQVVTADLATAAGPQRLIQFLQERQIQVDVLVNNAGFGSHGRFWEAPLDRELAMIQVNIASLVALTRLLLPGMIARRSGRILNVASSAAFLPGPLMANYYASKAYVLSFSEALSAELKRSGVHVTALCPGPTATEFAARAGMANSKLFSMAGLTAAQVAKAGYRGTMKNRRVVVPGLGNRLMTRTIRFVPKRVLLSLAKRLNQAR